MLRLKRCQDSSDANNITIKYEEKHSNPVVRGNSIEPPNTAAHGSGEGEMESGEVVLGGNSVTTSFIQGKKVLVLHLTFIIKNHHFPIY